MQKDKHLDIVRNAADAVTDVAKDLGDKAQEVTSEVVKNVAITADAAKDLGEDALKTMQTFQQDANGTLLKVADTTQQDLQRKIYRPVFLEDLSEPDFNIPKMIIIEDRTLPKDVKACIGAIGQLSDEAGLRVLHLFEKEANAVGLKFYPSPMCDKVYYMDPYDTAQYVDLSCYFELAQKDKMTELKAIARDLGAKHCVLETYESLKEISIRRAKVGLKADDKQNSANVSVSNDFDTRRRKINESAYSFDVTFSGQTAPKRPQLHWYARDREILDLIDSQLDPDAQHTKTYNMKIKCSTCETMSQKTAGKIDAALKRMKASANFSYEGEVLKESRLTMEITFEF